jgi:aspartate racemase
MSFSKTIGILGGMGPSASAAMYQKIIQLCQEQYSAVQDTDYPKIVLYSLPLTGFDETGIVDATSVLQQLHAGIAKLVHAGCDCIVMACNTVHVFYDQLQAMCPVPIVHIVEETVHAVSGHHVVGVLSSETTAKMGLYASALKSQNAEAVAPSTMQQAKVTDAITHVMAGLQSNADVAVLQAISQSLQSQGATAIILGCTELPLVLQQQHVALPLFDAVTIGAKVTLAFAQ